jgi:thiosulfate dehydrogenase
MRRDRRSWMLAGLLLAALAACTACHEASAEERAAAEGGSVEVELCDGETKTTVPTRATRTRDDGIRIADELMEQWRRKNPDADWVEVEREKHMIVPPSDNSGLVGKTQGHTYSRITEQHVREWERETLKLVTRGSQIFHSADELGSEIAVSCDMCHPDAANTHPETYPKFQTQLGRVVLLRDMINWCIEHPVRGEVLAPDSAEMRALEAYILAQRKGTPLAYGKH